MGFFFPVRVQCTKNVIDSWIKILPISPRWWIDEIWRHCWWSSWKGPFWPSVSAGWDRTGVLSALFDELSLLGLKQRDIVIFTHRVRSTREGYVLIRVSSSIHPSVCPHLGGGGNWARSRGGYPGQVYVGGPCWGYPTSSASCQTWGLPHLGYPSSDLVRGYPAGGYPTSVNRWSTWYAAMGMPLAFTQEDFLFLEMLPN